MSKEIELKIYSIASSLTESIIFLDEADGIRILPIWIGPAEAQAIAIKMSGYPSPRPMTHDLIFSMLSALKCSVKKILLSEIIDNTYYAKIFISGPQGDFEIDSRPSDAIALAVRFGCPIMVREEIFLKTQSLNKPISEDEVHSFKKELENLKPTDFFKRKKEGEDE
ncbi:MAG: bifunctional nuclease family protein [Elusimicrobia bacterium]|nr:bifunctional nuclease family protein [Elusimicrobiota bacterium]